MQYLRSTPTTLVYELSQNFGKVRRRLMKILKGGMKDGIVKLLSDDKVHDTLGVAYCVDFV
jgi:hypothetical protein